MSTVLKTGSEDLSELRGMASYTSGTLLVANAHKTDSQLFLASSCYQDGNRNIMAIVQSTDTDTGLVHPYGLAVDSNWNIYVSNQVSTPHALSHV